MEPVFIKQKPSTWTDEGLNKTILGLFKLRELPGAIVAEASKEELKYAAVQANPLWQEFKDYCAANGITGLKGLKDAPGRLKDMKKDETWKEKMARYF